MTGEVKPELEKRIADLIDGDSWLLADLLVEEFTVEEFGDAQSGTRTGLHEQLLAYEAALLRDYGLTVKASTLRMKRNTALAWPGDRRVSPVPYEVHRLVRGDDRVERMHRYIAKATKERRTLSSRLVTRYRAEDKPPKAPKSWSVALTDGIGSRLRSSLLGAVIPKDPKRWWEATSIGENDRKEAVAILRLWLDRLEP